MPSLKDHLTRVYRARSGADLEQAYRDWAANYDRDLAAAGYAYFQLVPAVVARHVDAAARVLDAGVGTGRLGATLAVLGFGDLTGIDLSEDMLALATTTGAYRVLRRMDLGQRLDLPTDHFDATYTAGTFTTGHAPPHGLRELARVTRPGGTLVVALTEPARRDDGFGDVLDALCDEERLRRTARTPPFAVFPLDPQAEDLDARIDVYTVT